MRDSDGLRMFVALAIAAIFLAGGIWWEIYRYNDCRKVGHSVMYCVFSK